MGQDLSINGLPIATLPLAGNEPVPVVQGGVTRRVAVGSFGQVVAQLDAGTQNADVALSTIYQPTDRGHLVLVCVQMATVKSDALAGDLQLDLRNTDQGGVDVTSGTTDLNLRANGRFGETFLLYVVKNSALRLEIANQGIYASSTYAYSYAVFQLT